MSRRVSRQHSRRLTMVAAVAALALAATACSGESDDAAPAAAGDSEDGSGDAGGEPGVIRLALAPDPIWDYMADNGIIEEWEQEHNLKIEATSSWDEFAYFAGGHGDIVSMGTHEVPILEAETGIETVTFGKYNHLKSPFITRSDTGYETVADIPTGSTMCAISAVGNTVFWSTVIGDLHDLNYRVGEGDYELVVSDHVVSASNIQRGDCEAGAVDPNAAIGGLRSGELVMMYDGASPPVMWQEVCNCDHHGIMSNLFIATAEWYDGHEQEAAAFNDLWQRGVDLWHENKAEIIANYPQHFAVETDEDIEWMTDYVLENDGEKDWFVDTVNLDPEWIERETEFYQYMTEHGWIDEGNFTMPRFEVVEAP